MTPREYTDAVVTLLSSKTSLRGVRILSTDDKDIENEIDRGLAKLGLAAIVGNSEGTNPSPNHPTPNFTTTCGVLVMENVVINRGRVLAATVADTAARLALTGISIGQKVHQTDANLDYWLIAQEESDAANWGVVLTASQILELVVRSLHHYHPSPSNTLVATGYAYDQDDDVQEVIATFETRTYLDPTPPE